MVNANNIDFGKLKTGMTFKNLKELGEYIGCPLSTSGKQRKLQLLNWEKHFTYKKASGYSVEVTEVFNIDKEPSFERQKYEAEIQYLLLKTLTDNGDMQNTRRNIIHDLSIVNPRFMDKHSEKEYMQSSLQVKESDFTYFDSRNFTKIERAMQKALKNLEAKGLIIYEIVQFIIDEDNSLREATDAEKDIIIKCKAELATELGINKYVNPMFYITKHYDYYYGKLSEKLSEYCIKMEMKMYKIRLTDNTDLISSQMDFLLSKIGCHEEEVNRSLNEKLVASSNRECISNFQNHRNKIMQQQNSMVGEFPMEMTDEYGFNHAIFHDFNGDEFIGIQEQLAKDFLLIG